MNRKFHSIFKPHAIKSRFLIYQANDIIDSFVIKEKCEQENIYILEQVQDNINLKDCLQDHQSKLVPDNNSHCNTQKKSECYKQVHVNLYNDHSPSQKKELVTNNINDQSYIQNAFDSEYTEDSILNFEINETCFKVEIVYDSCNRIAKATNEKDLGQLQWWLDKNSDVINDLIQKETKVFFKEDKSDKFYRGFYKEKKKSGFGIKYTRTGMIEYIGDWDEDFRHGKGTEFDEELGKIIYKGDWKYDLKNGIGIRYCLESGRHYIGGFQKNLECGFGSLYEDLGLQLQEGEWKGGRPHGHGKKYDEFGFRTYEGLFRCGIALYESNNKPVKRYHKRSKRVKYVGGEQNKMFHGLGRLYNQKGFPLYEGGWIKGQKNGIAKEYAYGYIDILCNNFIGCLKSMFCCCYNSTPRANQSTIRPIDNNPKVGNQLSPTRSRKSFAVSSQSVKDLGSAMANDNLDFNIIESIENLDQNDAKEDDEEDKDEFTENTCEFYSVGIINCLLKKLHESDLADSNFQEKSTKKAKQTFFGFYKQNRKIVKQKMGNIKTAIFDYYTEEYYQNGELKYKGYFFQGLRQGRGKYYYNNNKNSQWFCGGWKNGRIDGEGTLFSINGLIIYHGDFVEGLLDEFNSNKLIPNINYNDRESILPMIIEESLRDEYSEYDISSKKSVRQSTIVNSLRLAFDHSSSSNNLAYNNPSDIKDYEICAFRNNTGNNNFEQTKDHTLVENKSGFERNENFTNKSNITSSRNFYPILKPPRQKSLLVRNTIQLKPKKDFQFDDKVKHFQFDDSQIVQEIEQDCDSIDTMKKDSQNIVHNVSGRSSKFSKLYDNERNFSMSSFAVNNSSKILISHKKSQSSCKGIYDKMFIDTNPLSHKNMLIKQLKNFGEVINVTSKLNTAEKQEKHKIEEESLKESNDSIIEVDKTYKTNKTYNGIIEISHNPIQENIIKQNENLVTNDQNYENFQNNFIEDDKSAKQDNSAPITIVNIEENGQQVEYEYDGKEKVIKVRESIVKSELDKAISSSKIDCKSKKDISKDLSSYLMNSRDHILLGNKSLGSYNELNEGLDDGNFKKTKLSYNLVNGTGQLISKEDFQNGDKSSKLKDDTIEQNNNTLIHKTEVLNIQVDEGLAEQNMVPETDRSENLDNKGTGKVLPDGVVPQNLRKNEKIEESNSLENTSRLQSVNADQSSSQLNSSVDINLATERVEDRKTERMDVVKIEEQAEDEEI